MDVHRTVFAVMTTYTRPETNSTRKTTNAHRRDLLCHFKQAYADPISKATGCQSRPTSGQTFWSQSYD